MFIGGSALPSLLESCPFVEELDDAPLEPNIELPSIVSSNLFAVRSSWFWLAFTSATAVISIPARLLATSNSRTWLIVSIVAGFPARWETIFETVVAALTLAMVFVIQHTQARHQRATQRKLDEILLAIPGTDNALLTLEHASEDELHATGSQHRSIRQAALEDHPAPGSGDVATQGSASRSQVASGRRSRQNS